MRTAEISDEIIGRRIASPVYSKDGYLLLSQGSIVNDKILSKLEHHAISTVKILDSLSEGIEPTGIIEEKQMVESIRVVKNVFENVLYNEANGVSTAIPPDQMDLVEEVIQSLIDALEKTENLLYTVVEMLDTTEYTYKHSVNVAILSILTAKAMNYDTPDIKNIALGAFLHDVGKMVNDQDLINKPGKLTLEERKKIEEHPQYGFNIVKDISNLPYTVKQIVLLHHEKLDGSGYPFGLKGIEIPEFVRIVTVCDMYDAMTTDRIYRGKMPIYTTLEILMTDAVYKIDRNIYRHMTENICIYPPGSGVVLSDGRVGIVSFYRATNPVRPHVRVIDINTDLLNMQVVEVNLEKEHTMFVIDTWDVNQFKKGFKPKTKPKSSLRSQIDDEVNEMIEEVQNVPIVTDKGKVLQLFIEDTKTEAI